jgi:acyl-homoserine lactone acylase PvdQ
MHRNWDTDVTQGCKTLVVIDVLTTVHGVIISHTAELPLDGSTPSAAGDGGDGSLFAMGPIAKSLLQAAAKAGGVDRERTHLALAYARTTQPLESIGLGYQLNTCDNYEEFQAVVGKLVCVGLNWGYGDCRGNVGYKMGGNVPLRRCERGREMFVLPGWCGRYDWQGMIPAEETPRCFNPVQADGKVYVVSANSQMVDYRCCQCSRALVLWGLGCGVYNDRMLCLCECR